jgi:hypothetical protein
MAIKYMKKNQFYIPQFWSGKNIKLYAGGQFCLQNIRRCPACKVVIDYDEEKFQSEIELNYLGKLGFSPILWNSESLTIIRGDIANIWKSSGITGFEFGKVIIIGWFENKSKPLPENIPIYQKIIPSSKIKLIEPPMDGDPCPVCGFQRYKFPKIGTKLNNGIHIDLDSWDGSDINGLDRYNLLFCTEKVVRISIDSGISSFLSFIRADKYLTWQEFNYRKWKPKQYERYIEEFMIRKMEDLDK